MNTKIIVAVVFITGTGVVQAWSKHQPITRVIVGSYIFLLVLSIMDTIGGSISQLASALAMLAVVYILFGKDVSGNNLFPWDSIINLAQGKKA